MKLVQIGSNFNELQIAGLKVLFSYETPVAYQDRRGDYYRTNQKWIRTTTKHINQWLGSIKAKECTQSLLDNLISEEDF